MTSKGTSVVQGIGQLTSIQYNAKTNPVWAFLRITSARPVDIQLNSANTTDPTTPAWQHGFPCSEDSRAYTLHTTAAWDWRGARPRPRYQHTARMVASGGVNLRTCTANNAGSGRACRRERGGGGWRGVRACLPTKLGSPRYGEAGGDETAPRRALASGRGRRRRGPRARWPPPARVVAVVERDPAFTTSTTLVWYWK